MNPIRTAAAFAAALLAASVFAQTPPPPPAADGRPPIDGMRRAGPETTITGRVARWLVNPNGEVDGLLLDDGTQVGVAPHLSAQLTEAVQANDAVEVTGRRGENAKVVRASAIRSLRSGRSVGVEAREPDSAPAAPRSAGALTAMNASGRIDTLLYTDRGDVNGALLQDGTVVRFPPQPVAQLSDTLKPGAVLYARGYGTRSPQGSALEATAIGGSAETARAVFGGPQREARPPRPPIGDRPAPDAPPPVRAPA